jgi:hypothetical protein
MPNFNFAAGTSRSDWGAPDQSGSVSDAFTGPHAEILSGLSTGPVTPVTAGTRRPGAVRRLGSAYATPQNYNFSDVMGSISPLRRGDREATPEQQGMLDAFFSRDLSHIDPNTPEGARLLREDSMVEWMILDAGWGPEGSPDVTQLRTGRGTQFPEGRGRWIETNAQEFIGAFGERGPASKILSEQAGGRNYRPDTTNAFVDVNGFSFRMHPDAVTTAGEAGGGLQIGSGDWVDNSGPDLLLDAANIIARDRQVHYGADPYADDFTISETGGTGITRGGPNVTTGRPQSVEEQNRNVEPFDYSALVGSRTERRRRSAIGAGARGRSGRNTLSRGAGSKGLLLEGGPQTLGGGPSSTGAGI